MAKKQYIHLRDVKEEIEGEKNERRRFILLEESFKRMRAEHNSFTDDAREFIGNRLAQIYEEQGQPEYAGEVYREIGKFEKAGLNYARATKHLVRGQEEKRIHFLMQAAESYGIAGKKNTSKNLYKEAAKLFKKEGRKDAAAEMFERAGDFNEAGKAREALGEITLAIRDYTEAGQLDKAQALFDQYHSQIKDDYSLNKSIRGATKSSGDTRQGIPKRMDRAKAEQLVSLRRGIRQKHNSGKTLEHTLSVIAGIGLIGAFVFLSPNITGNAIADISSKVSNTLGIILLIASLLSGFLYFRKK